MLEIRHREKYAGSITLTSRDRRARHNYWRDDRKTGLRRKQALNAIECHRETRGGNPSQASLEFADFRYDQSSLVYWPLFTSEIIR